MYHRLLAREAHHPELLHAFVRAATRVTRSCCRRPGRRRGCRAAPPRGARGREEEEGAAAEAADGARVARDVERAVRAHARARPTSSRRGTPPHDRTVRRDATGAMVNSPSCASASTRPARRGRVPRVPRGAERRHPALRAHVLPAASQPAGRGADRPGPPRALPAGRRAAWWCAASRWRSSPTWPPRSPSRPSSSCSGSRCCAAWAPCCAATARGRSRPTATRRSARARCSSSSAAACCCSASTSRSRGCTCPTCGTCSSRTRWWPTPRRASMERQAIARCLRHGQTHTVFVHRPSRRTRWRRSQARTHAWDGGGREGEGGGGERRERDGARAGLGEERGGSGGERRRVPLPLSPSPGGVPSLGGGRAAGRPKIVARGEKERGEEICPPRSRHVAGRARRAARRRQPGRQRGDRAGCRALETGPPLAHAAAARRPEGGARARRRRPKARARLRRLRRPRRRLAGHARRWRDARRRRPGRAHRLRRRRRQVVRHRQGEAQAEGVQGRPHVRGGLALRRAQRAPQRRLGAAALEALPRRGGRTRAPRRARSCAPATSSASTRRSSRCCATTACCARGSTSW